MALDHYVSQVHLKNFYSPALGKRMYALRKSDLKAFECDSRSVCRVEDGSTNPYLTDERAIEDFLKGVEPKYNSSVSKLRNQQPDADCIYAIAGFVAYIACCAPAAIRILREPRRVALETGALIMDRQGLFPKAPQALE